MLTSVWVAIFFLAGTLSHAQPTQPAGAPSEEVAKGIRLYRQGDIDGALTVLRDRVQKSKDDALAWHYLGLSLSFKDDFKGARKALERAIKLRPDFASSHSALAYSLLYTKGVKDAEKQANLAFSLDSQDRGAHYVIGIIRLHAASCSEALAHADAIIVHSSDFAPAYLLKSQSLLCDIAERSHKPLPLAPPGSKTSSPGELSDHQKRQKLRSTAVVFAEAAANIERFLQLAPRVADAELWGEQLTNLRLYAEPANKSETERTVFNSPEITTRARVLSKPVPVYTDNAKTAGVVGTVILSAVFAADGTVKNILVLRPLPNGLTAQAIKAAQKIKFEPATKDGRAVSTYIQLEYNFNLY